MTTWITVCDTCKRDDWNAETDAQTDGERLAIAVETAAEGTDVKTRRVSCLMGCSHSCNIAIQAPGKLAYTLGKFDASTEAAEGIVEYAREARGSGDGSSSVSRMAPSHQRPLHHPPSPIARRGMSAQERDHGGGLDKAVAQLRRNARAVD